MRISRVRECYRGYFRPAALAILIALVAGCDGSPPDPLRSLSDLRQKVAIGPTGSFGWDCAINDELRPSLGCPQLHQLLHDVRPFPKGATLVPAPRGNWPVGKQGQ